MCWAVSTSNHAPREITVKVSPSWSKPITAYFVPGPDLIFRFPAGTFVLTWQLGRAVGVAGVIAVCVGCPSGRAVAVGVVVLVGAWTYGLQLVRMTAKTQAAINQTAKLKNFFSMSIGSPYAYDLVRLAVHHRILRLVHRLQCVAGRRSPRRHVFRLLACVQSHAWQRSRAAFTSCTGFSLVLRVLHSLAPLRVSSICPCIARRVSRMPR